MLRKNAEELVEDLKDHKEMSSGFTILLTSQKVTKGIQLICSFCRRSSELSQPKFGELDLGKSNIHNPTKNVKKIYYNWRSKNL